MQRSITVGSTAILRAGATSLHALAVLQIVGLIWPVKIFWTPTIDRYGSRRRGHHRSWLPWRSPAVATTAR